MSAVSPAELLRRDFAYTGVTWRIHWLGGKWDTQVKFHRPSLDGGRYLYMSSGVSSGLEVDLYTCRWEQERQYNTRPPSSLLCIRFTFKLLDRLRYSRMRDATPLKLGR